MSGSDSSSSSSALESGFTSDEDLHQDEARAPPLLQTEHLDFKCVSVPDSCVFELPTLDVLHAFLPLRRVRRRDERRRAAAVFDFAQRRRRLTRLCEGKRMRHTDDSLLRKWHSSALKGVVSSTDGIKDCGVVEKMKIWKEAIARGPKDFDEGLRSAEKALQCFHRDDSIRVAVKNGQRGVLIRTLSSRQRLEIEGEFEQFTPNLLVRGENEVLCEPHGVGSGADPLLGFHLMRLDSRHLVASKFRQRVALFDADSEAMLHSLHTTERNAANVCLSSINDKLVVLSSKGDVLVFDVETGRRICQHDKLYEESTETFQWAKIALGSSQAGHPGFVKGEEGRKLLRFAFRKQVYLFDARSSSRGQLLQDFSGTDRIITCNQSSSLLPELFYLADQSSFYMCDERSTGSPVLSSKHMGDFIMDSDVIRVNDEHEFLTTCSSDGNVGLVSFGAKLRDELEVKKGIKYVKPMASFQKRHPHRLLPSRQALCNYSVSREAYSELSVPWNGICCIGNASTYTLLASNEVGELFSSRLRLRNSESDGNGSRSDSKILESWVNEGKRDLAIEASHFTQWLKMVNACCSRIHGFTIVNRVEKKIINEAMQSSAKIHSKEKEWELCESLKFFQNYMLPEEEFSGVVGKSVLNIFNDRKECLSQPVINRNEMTGQGKTTSDDASRDESSMYNLSQMSFMSSQLPSQFLPMATSTQVTESTPNRLHTPSKKKRKMSFMTGF